MPSFYFSVEKINYPPERLADAHELIGTKFFDEHSDTQKALKYWRCGLAIRSANGVKGVPLPKRPVYPRRDTFRNVAEFTSLEELNAISLDIDALRMQSLLVCERILGPYHKDTLFRLMFRGASYADALRYVANCLEVSLQPKVYFSSIECDTFIVAKIIN